MSPPLDLPDRRLPDVDHRARRDRVRDALAAEGLDAVYVTTPTNVRWLTGFTGSNGQLLLAVDPDLDVFFTDGRYATQSAEQVPDLEQVIARSGVDERVADRLASEEAKALGFEADHLAWEAAEQLRAHARVRRLETRPVNGVVEDRRAVKDEHEIAALRAACALTDAGFDFVRGILRPGVTEREVAIALDRHLVDLGADGPSFETIVASGSNSAVPHHRPTERRLDRGDLVKLDFGAAYAGYHADMTRTVALGDPGGELRSVHDLVRAAQEEGVAAAVDGAVAGDVDGVCRDRIGEAGHGDHFLHGTGHGVGLDIHERPTVAAGASVTLQARMTVTVEPGVYLAGRGGVRIEDTIAVRPDGPPERLTTSTRELITL